MHLWVPFASFVFGGTGSGDQRGINDRALLHGHPPLLEVGLDDIKDFLPQFVLLEQVSEAENRCPIRDLVADQIDSSQTPHGGHLNQRIFHGWITESVSMLHQVNHQHGCQRV